MNTYGYTLVFLACLFLVFIFVFDAAQNNTETVGERISQIIVPHHLFAQKEMDSFYNDFSKENKNYNRVVIISPNHFLQGNASVVLRSEKIEKDGEVSEIDVESVGLLDQLSYTLIDNHLFQKEHGIFAHLSFIKKYFGSVPVVPIVLYPGTDSAELEKLSEKILELSGSTLIVYSVDFSHTLDRGFAEMHDQFTIDALQSLDKEKMYRSDIDCPECLSIAFDIAREVGQTTFTVHIRTSAADISSHDYPGENTSHILGSFTQSKERNNFEKKSYLLFAGDTMFDRGIREKYITTGENDGYEGIFGKIDRLMWAWDAFVFNLESVVSDNNSLSVLTHATDPNHLLLQSSQNSIDALRDGIQSPIIINDGNNHSLDFGLRGLLDSRAYLSEKNISFFGDVRDEEMKYIDRRIGDRDVRLVNYNAFSGRTAKEVVKDIRNGKNDGKDVIVYTHWGVENTELPKDVDRTIGRDFIDAGATIVIGSHPHVVQPLERYKNGVIFYSLGNFVFDQYYSEAVRKRLVVGCMMTDPEVKCTFSPLVQNESEPLEFMGATRRDIFYSHLAKNSYVDDADRESVLRGEIIFQR